MRMILLQVALLISWEPSLDDSVVAGYTVHYGLSSQIYSEALWAGQSFRQVIDGFVGGTTYYFAVSATGDNGLVSEYSEEVEYTVPLNDSLLAPVLRFRYSTHDTLVVTRDSTGILLPVEFEIVQGYYANEPDVFVFESTFDSSYEEHDRIPVVPGAEELTIKAFPIQPDTYYRVRARSGIGSFLSDPSTEVWLFVEVVSDTLPPDTLKFKIYKLKMAVEETDIFSEGPQNYLPFDFRIREIKNVVHDTIVVAWLFLSNRECIVEFDFNGSRIEIDTADKEEGPDFWRILLDGIEVVSWSLIQNDNSNVTLEFDFGEVKSGIIRIVGDPGVKRRIYQIRTR